MRTTPLAEEYTRHKGRVVDFHEWGLPLYFEGIIAEHLHVRAEAGVFDCSHMGKFLINSLDGIGALNRLVAGDMCSLRPGKCRYSALLNEDACVIDDCVALRLSDSELLLVTNAAPLVRVSALLASHVSDIENISDATAKIDVQGPKACRVLLDLEFSGVEQMSFWNGMRMTWRGTSVIVTRSGYTGELGYELYVPDTLAASLWRALTAHPAVMPCGLGARDTLRTEMGYPLSGQDMDERRTPLEAGMGRFIAWDTPFPGKARLEAQRADGDHDVLVALRSPDRRAPRSDYILYHDDAEVGVVTSGVFGPSVGCGVGLGYLPCALAHPGLDLCAGPRRMAVQVETPPIYKQASGRNRIIL